MEEIQLRRCIGDIKITLSPFFLQIKRPNIERTLLRMDENFSSLADFALPDTYFSRCLDFAALLPFDRGPTEAAKPCTSITPSSISAIIHITRIIPARNSWTCSFYFLVRVHRVSNRTVPAICHSPGAPEIFLFPRCRAACVRSAGLGCRSSLSLDKAVKRFFLVSGNNKHAEILLNPPMKSRDPCRTRLQNPEGKI